MTITASQEQLAAAFTEWDRRYREEPERFESDMARIMRGQTEEDYGSEAATYFTELLTDVQAEPDEGVAPPAPSV